MSQEMTVHHIPVCPFSQRLEILLALKGQSAAVRFRTVDITKPRDPGLLQKTRGTTALPVLELPDGRVLKESLVILRFLDETIGTPVRRSDPFEHAIESMLVAQEGALVTAGYVFVMNQDRDARDTHVARMDALYRRLDDFLREHNPDGTFLFDRFGLAEAVFAPIFMRFWFLGYYEGYTIPEGVDFDRVHRWRDACLAHPAAQQVSEAEILKLYYDYALGAGNGTLPEGRTRSSFVFEPHWRDRPMPPRNKYGTRATDAELGLV